MYLKKFSSWGKEKETIHNQEECPIYPKVREIWYVKMGINIGYEEDGKKDFLRPVLVLKKLGNLYFTIALTSKGKDNHYFYHKFKELDLFEKHKKHQKSSYIILSQAKTMDKKRFTQNIGWVSKNEFHLIKQKLRSILL